MAFLSLRTGTSIYSVVAAISRACQMRGVWLEYLVKTVFVPIMELGRAGRDNDSKLLRSHIDIIL